LACSSAPPERQLLTQFFRAARTRDNETLARMSAVQFRPAEEGEVTDFEITNVGEERRTPLDYKGLMSAQDRANSELEDYRNRRRAFESPNRTALLEIAKLEKDPSAKLTPAQQKLKAEWDKWRQDSLAMEKSAAQAKAALSGAMGPAEASLAQPGQPAFAVDKFQGELVSKDVTVNAEVRKANQTTQKTLIITIHRVEGTQDGAQRNGRPIITRIQGA
jgi:hypothetical protein